VRSVDVADDSTAFALTGTDIALDSLTGEDIAADSLTGEDIDESTLSDGFDTSVQLCRTDGPIRLATNTVRPVCTFGAFTISAQCLEDASDPIAMLLVDSSVDNAFLVFGPDTNDLPDYDSDDPTAGVFSVSSTNGSIAEKRNVVFAAPDGTQLTGMVGGRATAVDGPGDRCDLVVSLVG
jgi:hypothetical protein